MNKETEYDERVVAKSKAQEIKEGMVSKGGVGSPPTMPAPPPPKGQGDNVVKDDSSQLKSLGSKKTAYPNATGVIPGLLETIPNQYKDRDYQVTFTFSEFTSLCPKTRQPDFAEITIEYVPDELLLESKSAKLYFFSYRSEGSFAETITGRMTTDLVDLLKPKRLTVIGNFNPRGGIRIVVNSTYVRDKGVVDPKSS